jgi:hypothetical protein
MTSRESSGGAGGAGGVDHENRNLAWVASYAAAGVPLPIDRTSDLRVEHVGAQTGMRVDDIGIITSRQGFVLLQAKQNLKLETKPGSPLAKALDQVVAQYLDGVPDGSGREGAMRPVDQDRDLLVITTDLSAPATVRVELAALLGTLATHPGRLALSAAAHNKKQEDALRVVLEHLSRSPHWVGYLGMSPGDEDFRALFRVLRLKVLRLEPGQPERAAAETYLTQVLVDPAQQGKAFEALTQMAKSAGIGQWWMSRRDILAWLGGSGCSLAGDPRVDVAARDLLDRVSVSAAVPARLSEAGPAALLRADRHVVSFLDRPELARLGDWCDADDQSRAFLLTGAGGVGKTRLALQLAMERERMGWMCRIIRQGEEEVAVAAARTVSPGPVLLIVDYAEARLGLVSVLRAMAEDSDVRLRILMLARSRGEWWEQLASSTDASVRSLAATTAEVRLAAISVEAAAGDLVRAAVDGFALALDVPRPERAEVILPSGPVPILVLHVAALLAVLNVKDHEPTDPVKVVADERVLDELLVHEKAFWLGAAQTAHLTGPGGIDSVVLSQAVTVACLFAVSSEAEAERLLQRVPGLEDSSALIRRRIARWLRQLYPPDASASASATPGWWGFLQPDLVAERHVVGQLVADADLAATCLRGLGREQALRPLTLLARACSHYAGAPALLASALRADLAGLGVPAIEVAVQAGGPVGQVLRAVLADAPASLEELIIIQEAIPYPTLVLAAADATVTERIMRDLPDDIAPAERAHWADTLSTRLAQAGKLDQAIAPAQQAVTIYRDLAAADPGRHRPDLAAALANFGVRLHRLGHLPDAVAAAEEAITIRREFAQADPGRHLTDLAISLSNLGADFAELGKPSEALTAVQEAVGIHRQLAEINPGRYLDKLAGSLVNLAAMFSMVGETADARSSAEEAAGIFFVLARAHPDQYLPELATSLATLGALLADLGHVRDAFLPSAHAVALYRQLAEINPDRYQLELALSLTNLGTVLSELGRPVEALAQSDEAVAVLRDLAERSPHRQRHELASALSNLGISLAGLGRYAVALNLTGEAVTLYRDLARNSPDRYRPDLGKSVANLGIRLADLGRHVEAISATTEAVTVYRTLAAEHPERYCSDLASALADLGLRYSALGKASAALPVSQEAVRIHRELAETSPNRYRPLLANSLTYLGAIFAQLGRTTAALTTTEKASRIYRELAETSPDRYQAERAKSLANLGSYLSTLSRSEEALPLAEEAVGTYRQVAQLNPGRFDLHLAASLDSIARTLNLLDRTSDATAARAEAEAIRDRASQQ